MDIQGDIKWIKNELNEVTDPIFIEAVKKMLQYRKKVNEFSSVTSDEHKQVLDQRLKEHKKNPKKGKSWSEIKSDIQKKYGV